MTILTVDTKILTITAASFDDAVSEAGEVLRSGGLVAFPTETVYGLGADAFNETAVKRVFEVKGRPSDNPVIVHVSGVDQLYNIGQNIPSGTERLTNAFWPGPLTLVVRHRNQLPRVVTAGLPTVAVRMPDHPVALALIRTLSRGIVGPSANISGRPSPTTAQHVFSDLQGKIEIILDAGPTRIGVESTVIDLTTSPPSLLRLGGLPRATIEKIIGPISRTKDTEALRRSPGTRYRHYAPKAQVIIVPMGDSKFLDSLIKRLGQEGKLVGCILHSLDAPLTNDKLRIVPARSEEYAAILFDTMRRFDEEGVDVIIVEGIPDVGLGEAVMDRLRRASEPG